MSPGRLLEHFEAISEADDAVPRLRRFVLDLAVRGKLVPQFSSDEFAHDLLKRIKLEKDRLVEAGQLKKQGELPPVSETNIQFPLPRGWSPSQLGEIAACLDYLREPVNSTERNRRVAGKKQSQLYPYYGATQQQGWIDDYLFDEELVLLGEDGVPFFDELRPKAYLISGKSWVNNHAHVFRGILVSNRFLLLCLNAFDYKGRVAGSTRSKLNQARALDIPIAVPPLAEQHRIVAKVDELMALCDELEAARTKRETRRDHLVAATLHRLNNGNASPEAGNDPDFKQTARFYFNYLPRLTTRPEHIGQIRQTILRYAVTGRLTTRREESVSAQLELAKVEEKKRKLALRKSKTSTAVSIDEQWSALPRGWTWARWEQIADWITYGFTRPMPHKTEGVPIVTGKNVNYGKILFSSANRTTKKAFDELSEKDRPRRGDILLTKDGSIGRSAIVDIDEPFCINQSVAVLWLRACHFDRRFLKLAIDCPQTQEALLAKTEGVAIKHISVVDFGNMVLPIPPLAEQARIVTEVDELMALCDQLEAQLTATGATRRQLLEATLQEALAAT